MAKRLVLPAPFGRLQLETYEPAPPGPSQIQVKVLATSLNHLDWKRIKKNLFMPSFPHVLGMDIVGHVVDPGESQCFQEGDLIVSTGTVGYSDGCSYQTHALVQGDSCCKINAEIPVLGLSTLPFSLCTAACGLYLGLGLAKATDRSNDVSTHVLIWGANGGVGKLAIQLAKISGYSVVAVTSSNETTVQAQARGADYAFSRSDPDLITKIKSVAPNLRLAFDTVVTEETISQIVACCKKPARVATAIKYMGASISGVQLQPVYSGEIMGKTITGQPSEDGVKLGRWLWGALDDWLGDGQIIPLEYEALVGLQEVQEGLDRLESSQTFPSNSQLRQISYNMLSGDGYRLHVLILVVKLRNYCNTAALHLSRRGMRRIPLEPTEHPQVYNPKTGAYTMMPHIKQVAAGRRKSNMTRKEYFDHVFRIHGSISDAVEDKDQKPYKYIQTQVFDSAFGSRHDGSLNANHNWVGRDDTTELFFRDWDHVQKCFSSDYLKATIAPDGPCFADFETSIVLMAHEKTIPLRIAAATKRAEGASGTMDSGNATVVMYFISTPDDRKDGVSLEQTLTPRLVDAINSCCQDQVWRLICNIGAVSDHFDLNSYFGGANMPQYALVYKVFLAGPESVPLVRKAQAQFEKHAADESIIDPHKSFILFSQEALVMDVEKRVKFSYDRQPVFEDPPGPSHLD
ncbi:hypothetical protein FBULB1_6045 [Fusarium bulbicola]|nr:hypothetical protein FBULB1_6045 [Fusarium bulbicola]